MQTKTVAIRTQTLGGVWETTGVDRLRGVYPENDSYTADEFGSSKCSFDLHRDPGAIFPDITAFTPVDVEIGGMLVWSGRVLETPIREGDRIFNVQAQGWQYHLDDDVYQRQYVHTRLGDYRDMRGVPGATLGAAGLNAAAQVTVDGGQIYLGWPNGTTLTAGCNAAVLLDLGVSTTGKVISIDWESSNNTANLTLFARACATPHFTPGSDAFTVVNNTATSGTNTGTFATAARYIQLFVNNTVTGAIAADQFFRLVNVSVFADTTYQSGGVTVLKASQVVSDALTNATMLLSADRSGITVPTFSIPEFGSFEQRTPREWIQAANAVQDWRTKIDVYRRPIFEPKPSAAKIEIGAWPGSVFDDASANSGDEIYNRVIVQGTGPDGQQLSVERTQGQQAGASFELVSAPAPDNPSFATNAATWTPSGTTTMVRTTTGGEFASAPGGGKWGNLGIGLGDTLIETFTGTFQAGVTYRLSLALSWQAPNQGAPTVDVAFGSGSDVARSRWVPPGAFATMTVSWTPSATYTSGVTLKLATVIGRPSTWLIDSLTVSVTRPTLVDQRAFRRAHILPIKASLNAALGQQVGDVWLAAHKTTPLKGTVQITGDKACRDILTGASIPPGRLLTMTGDLLRLSHRVDPDTGGQGRDGRIAEVTYTPATDTAVVAIDSRRTSHEALLERLAVVVGGG